MAILYAEYNSKGRKNEWWYNCYSEQQSEVAQNIQCATRRDDPQNSQYQYVRPYCRADTAEKFDSSDSVLVSCPTSSGAYWEECIIDHLHHTHVQNDSDIPIPFLHDLDQDQIDSWAYGTDDRHD